MDFIIKEEYEIKQEQDDIETTFQIIELEHIFKPERIKEEFPDDPSTIGNNDIKIEPIEEELQEDCSTVNYNDIKFEPIEFQEDSISPKTNNTKFEPINLDHSYARAYQPFIDRTGKHKPKISEIKFKVKSPPYEPQICPFCGEKFAKRTPFEQHLLRHGSTPSLFECDVCGVKCKLMKHLQRHIMTQHISNVRVPCNVCGKSYHRHYLALHMSRHNTLHQKRNEECTVCGKCFQIRANLTSHMRTHRKKKAPCNVCGKSFVVPGPLRIHQRIHTGEKPYLCWICGSRFRARNTFYTHQKVHWTGTNFPCKLCDSKFKNPNCLDGHRRKVHGPKTKKIVKPLAIKEEIIVPVPVIKQESLSNDIKPNIYVNIRTY